MMSLYTNTGVQAARVPHSKVGNINTLCLAQGRLSQIRTSWPKLSEVFPAIVRTSKKFGTALRRLGGASRGLSKSLQEDLDHDCGIDWPAALRKLTSRPIATAKTKARQHSSMRWAG